MNLTFVRNPKNTSMQALRVTPAAAYPNPRLPALIMQRAFNLDADVFSEDFDKDILPTFNNIAEQNGWKADWCEDRLDTKEHYHSTSYEALAIASGNVTVVLGGVNGMPFRLIRGDVLLIPAGMVHCSPHRENNTRIVGLYPFGQTAKMEECESSLTIGAMERIGAVPIPAKDPFFADNYFFQEEWHQ